MKRIALIFSSIALLVLFSTSCSDDDDVQPSFDQSLIIGKWKSGTLFERYDADKSGATWDTEDDVTEDGAQTFTWSIDGDQLLQIHFGGKTPKTYTVTTLTASTLEYEDAYGNTKSFSKQ